MSNADPISRLNAALEGRYRIERQLGEGGMATVYLADDLRHERKVALKVLKPELAAVVGAERFLAEIKTTANLQHPHILPLFDSGEADTFLFYVMPYVEGESLREKLDRERQLPVDEAVQIAKDVAEALDYAHRHGVIHRDIKPANILLQDGKPVVSDFGIALAVGAAGGGRLTETGLSLGTPHYMSPEQATGDLEVGAATDVYALGCVLYEMLVGSPPFVASTPQAVLGKIVTGEPPSARSERKSVPTNADAAIRKALEKLPSDRLASGREFARALGDPGFRHGDSLGPGSLTAAGAWKLVSIGATTLAVLFAWLWLSGRTAPEVGTVPPEPFRYIVSPPEGTTLQTGGGFAITANGRTLLIPATGGLYRHELGGLESVLIPGTQNAWMPFVSPDDEWIGFIDDSEGVLKRVRIDGSGLQPLGAAPASSRSGAWSQDGTIIFNSGALGGLSRIPETGGESVPIQADVSGVGWLDLLPDGRTVLGGVGVEPDRVGLVSTETGGVTPLFPGTMARYANGHIVYWRDGDLWAVPFDPDSLIETGEHQVIVPDVAASDNGVASYVVSDDVLVYRAGGLRLMGQGMPVWVDREGNEVPLAVDPGLYTWPRISPDGEKVALTRLEENRDIWIHDLSTGVTRPLTTDPAWDDTPIWSPDSERVVFRSTRNGSSNLYSLRWDGSEGIVRLTDSPTNQRPIAFTLDGTLLFEEFSEFEGEDIWSLGMEPGAEPTLLLGADYAESQPTLSPDGRFIAYQSSRLGYPEIFVSSFPDLSGARMISTLNEGMRTSGLNADPREARSPLWSTNGREVFYQSGGAIVSVPVSTDGGFNTMGAPQVAFRGDGWPLVGEGRHYDADRDGRRILRIRTNLGAAASPNELVVVLNWISLTAGAGTN